MIGKFLIFVVLLFFNFIIGHAKDIGMIVVKEGVEVYEYPCIFSNVITTLYPGFFVVYRPEMVDKRLGDKYEDWLYIDTGKYEDPTTGKKIIFGWIRKNYVAIPDEFERVTNFESFKVIGWVGDSYWDYTFYKDGTYIRCDEKGRKIKGKIYKKGVVFLARDLVPTDSKYYLYNVFVLDREGYYNFPCVDENGELIRVKSEIYSSFDHIYSNFNYYILTGDNVNIRAKPTTNSAVLTRLKKGARVKVLEISEEVFRVGNREGLWVYVETGEKDRNGKPIRGWMVDIYLKPEE